MSGTEMQSLRTVIEKLSESSQKTSSYDPDSPETREKMRLEEEEREKRAVLERAGAIWAAAGLPERHKELSRSGLHHTGTEWQKAREEVVAGVGKGSLFVLLGNRGTGKTQLAVEAIRQACWKGLSSKYTKAMSIFLDIRDTYEGARSEKEAVKNYTTPFLLVIDAMEERGETPFEDRLLNHIIDVRYDKMYDTILVTNQTAEVFSSSAGPSIVSRIQETGKKIVCDWPSFRKPKGATE